MQLSLINQITNRYSHIYLSPHLDDAALSCGGAIARHNSQGANVLVVTLCTQVPAADQVFSAYAEAMHGRWQLAANQVVTARLHEDAQAIERLGADSLWADLPDAIYRLPEVYNSDQALFGLPASNDPLHRQLAMLLDELHARAPQAMFYAPLAIGGHVDHRITFDATVVSGWAHTTAFYEDTPYVHKPGALEARMAELQRSLVPSVIDIDATQVRKLDAIAAYSSQMNELFGGEAAMRHDITAYHETLRPEHGTYGERLWLMV